MKARNRQKFVSIEIRSFPMDRYIRSMSKIYVQLYIMYASSKKFSSSELFSFSKLNREAVFKTNHNSDSKPQHACVATTRRRYYTCVI